MRGPAEVFKECRLPANIHLITITVLRQSSKHYITLHIKWFSTGCHTGNGTIYCGCFCLPQQALAWVYQMSSMVPSNSPWQYYVMTYAAATYLVTNREIDGSRLH